VEQGCFFKATQTSNPTIECDETKKIARFQVFEFLPCYATLHEVFGILNLATLGKIWGCFLILEQDV
jgi:hypothetical protein